MEQLLLIEHLTYLHASAPLKSILDCTGLTVEQVIARIDESQLVDDKNYGSYITGADWRHIIAAWKRDPVIMQSKIVNTDLDLRHGGGGGLSIVVICPACQEAIVAFRGTAPAEWADDFEGANVISTAQQENALRWYREIYQELNLSQYYVTIVGHSKGGNKAKFITILDDTPDRCVAFDGQGFSDKFIRAYADQIRARKSVIENHNIDYDYVNILLNDVGKRHFYQGYNYGRGGLAESHCPNTFFDFRDNGEFTFALSENGQSLEMQELDKFLNSYTRSMPSDQEATEATELIGQLVERAFNLKNRGDTITDYVNFICEMVSDSRYNDNVAFLLAFVIHYENQNPGFMEHISNVLHYFNMDGLAKYIKMVQGLLGFPGLKKLIRIATFFTDHLPDRVLVRMQAHMKKRFDVDLTREQLEGMPSVIGQLKDVLNDITIADEGLDLEV